MEDVAGEDHAGSCAWIIAGKQDFETEYGGSIGTCRSIGGSPKIMTDLFGQTARRPNEPAGQVAGSHTCHQDISGLAVPCRISLLSILGHLQIRQALLVAR